MKGKYKLFAIGLASLCASVSVASAKSMTATEIAEAITAQNPNATYAYVIGSYVFTGSHMLSTNDVMVGSKTIESNDPEDQYINVLQLNESTNKWEYDKNLLGSLISSSTGAVDIQYIDYVPTSDSVNVDKTVADEITKLGDADNNAIISINKNVITVKVSDTISSSTYTTLADDIINLLSSNDKIASIVISQLDADGEAMTSSAVNITKNTAKSTVSSRIKSLADANSSFTIEVKLVDGVVNAGKYTTYTVNFVTIVDTDKAFTSNKLTNGAYYTFDCTESENGNCSLVLDLKQAFVTNNTDSTATNFHIIYSETFKPSDGTATGGDVNTTFKELYKVITDSLENDKTNVKSITVKIGGDTKVFTTANKGDVKTFFVTAFKSNRPATTGDLTYSDLINQKIIITFTLEDNVLSQNDKSEEVYSVTITGTTNTVEQTKSSVETLNTAVKNSDGTLNYNVVFDEDVNTILFQLPTSPNLVPFNSNSDLVDVISDFYFSGLYKSVTVSASGFEDKLVLNEKTIKDIIDFDGRSTNVLTKGDIFIAFLDWLYEVGGKESVVLTAEPHTQYSGELAEDEHIYSKAGNTYSFNLSTLVGRTLTLELEYANEGVKDKSGVNSYSIVFANSVKTDDDTKDLVSKLSTVAAEKIDLQSNNVIVDLTGVNESTKLDADALHSTLMSLAQNKYASIKVTYGEKTYTIKYTKGSDTQFDDFGDLNNLRNDLNNKKVLETLNGNEIKIEYTLLSNSVNESENGEVYTIKFRYAANTRNEVETFLKDKVNGNILVPVNAGTDKDIKYISDDNVITLEVVSGNTSLNKLGYGLEGKLLELFRTNNYKSIVFHYDGNTYEIKYTPANTDTKTDETITGISTLINAIGGDYEGNARLADIAKEGKIFDVEFVLADGVIDYVKAKDESGNDYNKYTNLNTLTYSINLSIELDVNRDMKTVFDSNAYAESEYVSKLVDEKINVLYSSSSQQRASYFFRSSAMLTRLITLLNDARYTTIEINIGSQSVRVVRGEAVASVQSELEKALNTLVPGKSKIDDIKVSDVIKALGNEKMTIVVNVNNTVASIKDSTESKKTYEIVFSKYYDVTTLINNNITSSSNSIAWTQNEGVVKVAKDQYVDINSYFKANNVKTIFDADSISSITIDGEPYTASRFKDVLDLDGGETPSTNVNILIKEMNNRVLNYVKSLGINVSDGKAKSSDLFGKSIEFKVTMKDGILSNNGNTEETFKITFEENKAS